jgi:hypothetical protein
MARKPRSAGASSGPLLDQLKGGDRRSIGAANSVVELVLADPSKLGEIIRGITSKDPIVRMRCADVVEKVSTVQPDWLRRHKKLVLRLTEQEAQKEVRWHLAQMLPRLRLTSAERKSATAMMFDYLDDPSHIVKVCALQALADLSASDAPLRRRVRELLSQLQKSEIASLRSRARRLLMESATR